MSFKNKTAIVTGAGQGIGFEMCRQLVAEGANVVLNDIDLELAANAAKQLAENGVCIAVAGDSGTTDCIQLMMDAALTRFGAVDIVIANAGITLFGDFFEYTPEAFYKVMQVNLGGSFFLAQAAARQMKQQIDGGALLFMSSVTGHQAHKNLAAYGITKAALE